MGPCDAISGAESGNQVASFDESYPIRRGECGSIAIGGTASCARAILIGHAIGWGHDGRCLFGIRLRGGTDLHASLRPSSGGASDRNDACTDGAIAAVGLEGCENVVGRAPQVPGACRECVSASILGVCTADTKRADIATDQCISAADMDDDIARAAQGAIRCAQAQNVSAIGRK